MMPIPPTSLAPTPSRPSEETPAAPPAVDDAGQAPAGDGAGLLDQLANLFGLHPDVKAAADPALVARAAREFEQGEALFKAGRYADAIEHFDKAQSLVPAPANHFNAALCLERLGRHEDAAQRFEAYAAAAPDAADAGAMKAHAATLHDTARDLARAAYDQGTAAMNAGRFAEAASAFRQAREHLPSSAATYMLAKSLDLGGASTMAVVREYQRYLNEAPNAGDAQAVRDRMQALLEATGDALMKPA